MTKFNKSLLTAAVVGVLAIPSLASAASLGYPAGKQITFAKDLLVNDGTTINVPADLTLAATTDDAGRIISVASNNVTVKVTLTDGAKFDSTADATTLVNGFLVGQQLGGALGGAAPVVVGTPYYSAAGQELNFTITAPGNGTAAGDFAIKLNSMQITNLIEGLYLKGTVSAQITAQNSVGQQILAAKSEIAKSVWGLAITSDLTSVNNATTIDVAGGGTGTGAIARKTRFAPNGDVGGSVGNAANALFNAGAIVIDVAKANLTSTGIGYVNNFSAVATNPEYNVVSTAKFDIQVKGSNLTAFSAGNLFLDNTAACNSPSGTVAGTVNTAGDAAAFSLLANHAYLSAVTNPSPGPSSVFVCFRATNKELTAQPLSASVGVDYQLSTQRRNPEATTVALAPLKLNGATLVFQNVNPAGNASAQSFLRITNNNADVCPITIDAKDDAGRHSGEVKVTLGAHQSKQLNSEVLEGNATSAGVTGAFGKGTGKWYVRVTAECSNFKASALNRHQDGVVTDLTPEKGEGVEWLTPAAKI